MSLSIILYFILYFIIPPFNKSIQKFCSGLQLFDINIQLQLTLYLNIQKNGQYFHLFYRLTHFYLIQLFCINYRSMPRVPQQLKYACFLIIMTIVPTILAEPMVRPIAKSGIEAKSSQDIYRDMVIAKTDERIKRYNALYGNYFTSAHNQFSAYSEDQMKALLGGSMSDPNSMERRHVESVSEEQKNNLRKDIEVKPGLNNANLPKIFSVDYSLKVNPRAVTPVKNQGSCGSCWAFGGIAQIQSYFLYKYKLFLDLSEQQMVDCVVTLQPNNYGCGGGYLDSVGYYSTQVAIAQQKYYKYTAKQGTCNQAKITQGKTFKIKSYAYAYDCIMLISTLLATKPIGVCGSIGDLWNNYSSGVLPNCGTTIIGGHCFLLVGAASDGTTNTQTNWYKFKNSWGTGWGEKGYIRIYRDASDSTVGPCKICSWGGLYSI